jgi:hypothetical protein
MKKNYKKMYEELAVVFAQWQLESIKWSACDFTELQKNGWQISEEQAQDALEDMIRHSDCNFGTTWEDVDYYYEEYGEKVEEGKEAWRKLLEELESQE